MRSAKSVRSSNLDIISYLQSNIIENILIFLPLRDAVRTSILSSKWRYKWVTLPQLLFDTPIHQEFTENLLSAKHKFVMTIYQVLLRHKGPILKFFLSNRDVESCSDIDQWILFLLNNDIQDFTLGIWRGERHKLPSYFYSFLRLRHLNLYSCVFKPPPTFKGLSKLVSLAFENIVVAAEIFGIFLSSCPLLEQLTLCACTFECLEIDAPNLKLLSFIGTFKTICFKNTPLLAIVTISLALMAENVEHPMEGETSNLIKLFGCLPVIENLSVHNHFLKFLAVGNVPKRLPITLKHLKSLELSDMCFGKVDEISCALCLIRSSPNLRKLKIVVSSNTNNFIEPVVEFLQEQDFSNWSLKLLRKVKMRYISGSEPELEFIKFVLASSTVLETMSILPSEGVKDND